MLINADFVSHFASIIFFLVIFMGVVGFFKSRYFKGKVGEFMVAANSALRLDSLVYKRVENVTLRLQDGSTTQIDHIILSPFGIFVIETKNMQGWIFGSEHQKEWTQSIYGKRSSFQNPLRQNYRHIKALEEVLGINRGLFSIVTFVGESRFKTKMPVNVFAGGGYIAYIQSFRERLFSDGEVAEMVQCLESMRLVRGRESESVHQRSLKQEKLYENDPKISCKRCGSVMVERRNRKSGESFLGCSRYPQCRNTERLEGV